MTKSKKTVKKQNGPGKKGLPAEASMVDVALPDSLEEAIVLLYALAFGSIRNAVIADALALTGMTMPDGAEITPPKILPYINNLVKEELLVTSDREFFELNREDVDYLECDVDLRWASFDRAHEEGWLLPFGRILQQVDPAGIPEAAMDYKWDGQRFVSADHASRDVFLALETEDQAALSHLIELCRQDQRIPSPAHILYAICIDPLHPDYLSLLDIEIQTKLLYVGLHTMVSRLCLNHTLFDHARSQIRTTDTGHTDETLLALVAILAERDLLCGERSHAQALLTAHPNAASPQISRPSFWSNSLKEATLTGSTQRSSPIICSRMYSNGSRTCAVQSESKSSRTG